MRYFISTFGFAVVFRRCVICVCIYNADGYRTYYDNIETYLWYIVGNYIICFCFFSFIYACGGQGMCFNVYFVFRILSHIIFLNRKNWLKVNQIGSKACGIQHYDNRCTASSGLYIRNSVFGGRNRKNIYSCICIVNECYVHHL